MQTNKVSNLRCQICSALNRFFDSSILRAHLRERRERNDLSLGKSYTYRNQANYQLNRNVLSTRVFNHICRTNANSKHTKRVVSSVRHWVKLMWYRSCVPVGALCIFATRLLLLVLLVVMLVWFGLVWFWCSCRRCANCSIFLSITLGVCLGFLTAIFSECVCVSVFISISFTCPGPSVPSLCLPCGHFAHFRDAFVTLVLFHFHLRFRVRNCGLCLFSFWFLFSFSLSHAFFAERKGAVERECGQGRARQQRGSESEREWGHCLLK